MQAIFLELMDSCSKRVFSQFGICKICLSMYLCICLSLWRKEKKKKNVHRILTKCFVSATHLPDFTPSSISDAPCVCYFAADRHLCCSNRVSRCGGAHGWIKRDQVIDVVKSPGECLGGGGCEQINAAWLSGWNPLGGAGARVAKYVC